jgi:hypothetical protein
MTRTYLPATVRFALATFVALTSWQVGHEVCPGAAPQPTVTAASEGTASTPVTVATPVAVITISRID